MASYIVTDALPCILLFYFGVRRNVGMSVKHIPFAFHLHRFLRPRWYSILFFISSHFSLLIFSDSSIDFGTFLYPLIVENTTSPFRDTRGGSGKSSIIPSVNLLDVSISQLSAYPSIISFEKIRPSGTLLSFSLS